jgi:hypothetical protein
MALHAPRIKTVDPKEARGLRGLMMMLTKRQMGGMVPGIQQIVMTNLKIGIPTYWLYSYLNVRKGSPLSRLQREMLATVVNGLVGGAP